MTASPQHVSRVLKAAGLTKSSPYTPWGYKTEGYIVNTSHDGSVNILWSIDKREQLFAAAEIAEKALQDAGFVYERAGRWDDENYPSRWFSITDHIKKPVYSALQQRAIDYLEHNTAVLIFDYASDSPVFAIGEQTARSLVKRGGYQIRHQHRTPYLTKADSE